MMLEVHESEQAIHVKVAETRFDAAMAPHFIKQMQPFLRKSAAPVIVDLTMVEFIDSSGLGSLVSVLKQRGLSGEFMVCGATGAVADLFALTKMDRVFTLAPDYDQALAMLVV